MPFQPNGGKPFAVHAILKRCTMPVCRFQFPARRYCDADCSLIVRIQRREEAGGGNHVFRSREFHEAAGRSGAGVCIGDGGIRDDDGDASNRRSETDAGAHASFSVTFLRHLRRIHRPSREARDRRTRRHRNRFHLNPHDEVTMPIYITPSDGTPIHYRPVHGRGRRGRFSYV